jgi:SAM-dependent methyltransferase
VSLADAWEDNARDWIAWARAPGHDGFWNGTWPALMEIMPEPDGGLVLDLGCGEGRSTRLLQAAGRQVIGVERSPTLARAAATGSPPVPVILGDAAALPFAGGTIGLAVACMTLMDVDDFDGAVAEVARVLRPGGQFCLAVVHPFDSAHDSQGQGGPLRMSRPYLQARRYEDHFERDGLAMTFVSMHRPLGDYTAAIFGRGMVITDLREHGDGDFPWLLAIRAEKGR